MELLLPYLTNQNNGLSPIATIQKLNVSEWGSLSSSNQYLIVPVLVAAKQWKLFSYVKNAVLNTWNFNQLVDIGTNWADNSIIKISNTDLHIYVLNSTGVGQCEIYELNIDNQWSLVQSITVSATIAADPSLLTISASIDSDNNEFFIISDANISTVYTYQLLNGIFTLVNTFAEVSLDQFGYSAVVNNGILFVGAPYKTNTSLKDGSVFIYRWVTPPLPALPTWTPVTELVAPIEVLAYGYFGFSIDATPPNPAAGVTDWNLIVGVPGYNSNKGRVYYYKIVGGSWTANGYVDELTGSGVNNQFGSTVSMLNHQSCIGSKVASSGNHEGKVSLATAPITEIWAISAEYVEVNYFGASVTMTLDNAIATSQDYVWSIKTSTTPVQFMDINTLFVKSTAAGSFYHSTTGNTQISFKLTYALFGQFQVEMQLKNNLETIGEWNNTIYWIEYDSVANIWIPLSYSIAAGTYTEIQLAYLVESGMNLISSGNNYTMTYNAAPLNKYQITADQPFSFGALTESSLTNNVQQKVMGFYNNSNTVLQNTYLADREAQLANPTQIGVKIAEAFPSLSIQNNNPFAEIGLIATLTSDHYYKILLTENQIINIRQSTQVLTFTFPDLAGGVPLNVNTNDLNVVLKKI